jgi:hypothetical protein
MKNYNFYFLVLFFSAAVLTACNNEEVPENPFPSELVIGCYIVNSGVYGQGGASISKFDYETSEITNFYYQAQNGGNELLPFMQYANAFNDSVFLIGNAPDQIITLNPLFRQTRNGLTGVLENPRYFVGDGDYLYISCWGTDPDWADMPGSYIAKYNITTNSVEKTFAMPGGPEGLIISNGKLYAALNYVNQLGVLDLTSETVSTITTPAVSSYFLKDKDGNLYFTMLSTYADFSEETGIGFINTTTDQVEAIYTLENVSTGYGSMMQADKSFTKIYLITSTFDENWNVSGEVAVFDVASKMFSEKPVISDIPGISGLIVNPVNNDIYVFSAESATSAGNMKVYSSDGTFKNDYGVGSFPTGAFFLE